MHVHPRAVPVVATLLAGLIGSAHGFWRMPCRGRTAVARIDPLVSPGKAAHHAHVIHGSSGFGIDSKYEDLVAGDCTSCAVTQDKSVYWAPGLYFQGEDGKFELVEQMGGMLAYYLLMPNPGNDKITAFPAGFEMLIGDTNQRNFTYPVPDLEKSAWTGEFTEQPFLRQAAIGFNCLNYQRPPEATLYRHFLPDKEYLDANCANGVRFELMFPSCWNGKDVTSEDKQSHVAYPSTVMGGTCPEGFPERVPGLLYEIIWATEKFIGKKGKFIISNGDPTGFGYHADFMTGWDVDVLQRAVDTCTNLSGMIQDCPVFDIQSDDESQECKIELPEELENEEVMEDLDSMPGKPVIASGPGYAAGSKPDHDDDDDDDDKAPAPANPEKGYVPVPAPVVPVPAPAYKPKPKPDVPVAAFTPTPVGYPANTPTSTPLPTTSSQPPSYPAAPPVDPKPAPPATTLMTSSLPPVATQTVDGMYTTLTITRDGMVLINEYYLDVVVVTAPSYPEGPFRKRHLHNHHRGIQH
ncbi:hypothetical protein LZ554_008654 [Drepanopeziza brunnea f. sp. 'monogermtubi']|nr:hypothetical protein LZ554_008654 [Drepanopeziza brunnea f. sp. 'monogermtubi']